MMCWIDRLYNIVNSHTTNKGYRDNEQAKKETCGWQNTDLTTLTRWHTGTGLKFTLTATGSNDIPDLLMAWCFSLVETVRARSNTSGLFKCLGAKFPEKKRVP